MNLIKICKNGVKEEAKQNNITVKRIIQYYLRLYFHGSLGIKYLWSNYFRSYLDLAAFQTHNSPSSFSSLLTGENIKQHNGSISLPYASFASNVDIISENCREGIELN